MSNPRTLTREKLHAEIEMLKRSIDFEDLASSKIMVKEGSWYRVLKIQELPEHVMKQVREFADDGSGKLKVRFRRGARKKL